MISKKLKKNSKLFKRFTGLTRERFSGLLCKLEPIYNENEKFRLTKKRLDKPRKRAIGGGLQFKLTLEDRLLLVILYYRFYLTHEFLGILFNLDDSNISRTIKHINPLLARIFHIPERKIKLSDDEIEEIKYLFIDGTEQPIQRPKNRKKQKSYYSGKKKRHTIKVQVVTRNGSRVDAVSGSHNGRKHDKKIYDETRFVKPPGTKGIADTGYEGTILTRPIKRKKGKKLTKAQKKYNRKISSIRIKAEHVIARMKKYKIAKDIFRNKLSSHNLYIKNVAGLVNFAQG